MASKLFLVFQSNRNKEAGKSSKLKDYVNLFSKKQRNKLKSIFGIEIEGNQKSSRIRKFVWHFPSFVSFLFLFSLSLSLFLPYFSEDFEDTQKFLTLAEI